MRGEVNEAISAEGGVKRRIAASGEVTDDSAVADQQGDLSRLPVGRRKATQIWQGDRIGGRRIVPSSFAHSRRSRPPASGPADTIIGGRKDRVGKDNDAALGGSPHSRLPRYRHQRRGRGRDDNFMVCDQRSVGGGRTGRRGDRATGRRRDRGTEGGGEIRARAPSIPLFLCRIVALSPRPYGPPPRERGARLSARIAGRLEGR